MRHTNKEHSFVEAVVNEQFIAAPNQNLKSMAMSIARKYEDL
ncbi:hypothetical protein [Desulfosediminicola ganghwensis]|nr:hypothetical protein [Desulfosediminicola ganghwensis]